MQVSRCLTLLSQDEGAATAFYSRLHQHAGVPSASKIIAMLARCVLMAARADDNGRGDEDGNGVGDERRKERGKRIVSEGGGKEELDGEDGSRKEGGVRGSGGKRKGLDVKEGGASRRGKEGGGGITIRASDSKVRIVFASFCACLGERGGLFQLSYGVVVEVVVHLFFFL